MKEPTAFCFQSKWITEIRIRSGLTQSEMAQALRTTLSNYNRIERGRYQMGEIYLKRFLPILATISQHCPDKTFRELLNEFSQAITADYTNSINRFFLTNIDPEW